MFYQGIMGALFTLNNPRKASFIPIPIHLLG